METGAFGWAFKDRMQPILDDYDRRIDNVWRNGAIGQLAQMQAQDDALGVTAGNVAGTAVPRAGDSGLIPLAGSGGRALQTGLSSASQNVDPTNCDNNFYLGPAHLTLGEAPPAPKLPDSAVFIGHTFDRQAAGPQKADPPDTTRYSTVDPRSINPAGDDDNYGSYLPPPTDAKEALKDQDFGYRASDALNAELSKRKILGTTYSDFNTALGAWADTAQPFQERFGTELSSNIYAVPGGWQIGPSYSNGSRCSGGEMCTTSPMPGSVPSGLYWGYIHTHPTNFGGLDYADTNYGRGYTDGKPDDYAGGSYVSLPNGQINGWMRGMSPPDRSNPGTGQFMIRPPQNRPRGFR